MAQKREPCRKEGTEWKSGIMASEDVDANQPMRETAERVGTHDIISIMPGISKDSPNLLTQLVSITLNTLPYKQKDEVARKLMRKEKK